MIVVSGEKKDVKNIGWRNRYVRLMLLIIGLELMSLNVKLCHCCLSVFVFVKSVIVKEEKCWWQIIDG